ncbi:MAG: type I restriction endonuclease subunit R, partial [Desulfobacteraceae bacterium]|nr:type I restriction endonuclease subunit R [Desulfobacteraceae bacterium]
MITEAQLEDLCIQWFKDGGYEYAYGPDIAYDGECPERKDYRQVVLADRLLSAMHKINPQVPVEVLSDAITSIENPESPVLTQNNKNFHKLLLEGVDVEFQSGDATINDNAFLIDFEHPENNEFLVVNQFTIQGTKMNRRPDLVIFINGLPIAVLELKNPGDENADVWSAFSQLQTYKEEISDLFVFNEALIISDGITARVGSLTANKERFMPWHTVKHENDKPIISYQLEKMVRGFFDRDLLLDYIRYFIIFEQEGDTITKKIAGYHQFHAVREAVWATMVATGISEKSIGFKSQTAGRWKASVGSRKAGVIWHTQGSGKSISMCCYAGKLLQQSGMNNPTIVVVTDRNDLDGQLYQTFCNAKELLRQTPEQADNRGQLRDLLESKQSGGIIFTTVQKFSLLNGEEVHPSLSNRSNI